MMLLVKRTLKGAIYTIAFIGVFFTTFILNFSRQSARYVGESSNPLRVSVGGIPFAYADAPSPDGPGGGGDIGGPGATASGDAGGGDGGGSDGGDSGGGDSGCGDGEGGK